MFLILCSYVYLTCLPGFPTRFTGSRIVVQIPWGSSTSTAPRPWDSPSTPTISSPTARNRFVSILRTFDVHDLAVMACRWTVGPKAAVFFVNKKTCGLSSLSLKNHVLYTIVYILFFGPHSPIPFQTSPIRGRAVAWWLRWSIPRPLASSRWRPRRWTTTGAMWNWRRSWTPSPGVQLRGFLRGIFGGLGGCCLGFLHVERWKVLLLPR